MEILTQEIVSIPKTTIEELLADGKETFLFFILLTTGKDIESIEEYLATTPESTKRILAILKAKKLVKLDKIEKKKKAPKMTYFDSIEQDVEAILLLPEEQIMKLDSHQRWKLVVYFYAKLSGHRIVSDAILQKVVNKINSGQASTKQLIEAIWRNSHHAFCNWMNDTKWWWDLNYLSRPETSKSQPLERSLKRQLDMVVPDSSKELLEKYIWAIPALKYILTIPCKYEALRSTEITETDEDILRRQREVKNSLGLVQEPDILNI